MRSYHIGDCSITTVFVGKYTHSCRHVDLKSRAVFNKGLISCRTNFQAFRIHWHWATHLRGWISIGTWTIRVVMPTAIAIRNLIEDAYSSRTTRAKRIRNLHDHDGIQRLPQGVPGYPLTLLLTKYH
ncbi:MAG: hypothetical protein ABIS50_06735 [Luteolibacter sp.]|uniref:hypothetical protein n=1 Tax=Luteolibacter sp. TaxID=1962973 RepID=UPI0032641A84